MRSDELVSRSYLTWILVLVLAFVVRLIFVAGVAHEASVSAARIAWELAEALQSTDWQGLIELRGVYGLRTLLVFAPLSLVYLLAGVSDVTSLFLPFLLAIVNTALVITFASRIIDIKTGFIAGLLWAVLPLDVYWTNTLSFFTPLITITLLGLLFTLRYYTERKKPFALIAISCWFLLLFIEPFFGVNLMALILTYWAVKSNKANIVWLSILASYIAVVVLVHPNILFSSYLGWLERPGATLLFVLMLASLVNHLLLENQRTHFLLAWLALAFLGINLMDYLSMQLAGEAVVLLLSVPQILLVAQYLSNKVSEDMLQKAIWVLAPSLVFIVWLGVSGQRIFIPDNSGSNWFAPPSIFPVLEIISGLMFLVAIFSPRLLQIEMPSFASTFALFTLAGILFVQAPATWELVWPQRQLANTAKTVWGELSAQELALPARVNDGLLMSLIAYTSSFSLDEQLRQFEKRNQIDDAYVVAYENGLAEIPDTWWHLGFFGSLGQPRLSLYRALSTEKALEQLLAAQAAVDVNPGSQSYLALHAALMNTGEVCQSYDAWLRAQKQEVALGAYLVIDTAKDCQISTDGGNLLEWPVPRQALHPGFLRLREGADEHGVRVNKRYNFYYDPRAFDLNLQVHSDTAYLYQAEVRSNGPLLTLYWNLAGVENYAGAGSYREWTHISVLIVTPPSNAVEKLELNLSPVLFDHFDFVEVRNVQLQKVAWPK